VINSFRGANRFLSNFYDCKVKIRGKIFPTAEHAYQCAKTDNEKDFKFVFESYKPGEAKRRGRVIKKRSDWEHDKLDVMREIVLAKFQQNEDLAIRLVDTGEQELIEGNEWGDTFWGVCKGKGENWLGKILMEVRQILKENGGGKKKIPLIRTL
jgi:hypothetical protein